MANNTSGNPGNFANDPEKAREAGRVGGTHQGQENNPANFANDREKAAEAGSKGGQASQGGGSGGGQQASQGGGSGGGQQASQGSGSGGNFANDREKASEAGRKGGQASHGGGRS